ncbi:PIN domain-containing protein [Flammeovirgaceae bacterium SG7u.111]|nr:PIN domain-containing protein [Flammeovirgaceae bacterium SG7u.132]WPO33029.1 PIN domain-containing protein [Flammeovirgaceae bacterium SG7u.111]
MKPKIIIDTSILRKHKTLKTDAILLLAELSKREFIEFIIPEIVRIEFLSQLQAELEEEYDKIISHLKALTRKSLLKNNSITSDIEKYKALKNEELKLIESKWRSFRRNSNLSYESYYSGFLISRVFNDYTKGNPPFSSKKNRKDIPDAFIYHNIKSIDGNKYFLCNDQNLSNAVITIKNTKVLDSIDKLFEEEELKAIISKLESLGNVKSTIDLLIKHEKEVKSIIEFHLLSSVPFELHKRSGKAPDLLTKISTIEEPEIHYSKARLYEDGSIFIPFELKIDCVLEEEISIDKFESIKSSPFFYLITNYIEFIEFEDKVIQQDTFSGTITSSLKIKKENSFDSIKESIDILDFTSDWLVSKSLNKLADDM